MAYECYKKAGHEQYKIGDKLRVIDNRTSWIRSLPFKNGDIVEFVGYDSIDADGVYINIKTSNQILITVLDITRFEKINGYTKEYR